MEIGRFTFADVPAAGSASATRRNRVRLISAVTVVGSDDRVRVVEQSSALDPAADHSLLLTRGRMDIADCVGDAARRPVCR